MKLTMFSLRREPVASIFLALTIFVIAWGLFRDKASSGVCLDMAKFGERQQTQQVCFAEVRRVAAVPRSVRSRIGRRIANPGGLFNATDVKLLPFAADRRMVFAGISDEYCILHYEYGGFAHGYMTAIFRLSRGQAIPIWADANRRYSSLKDFANESDLDQSCNDLDRIIF